MIFLRNIAFAVGDFQLQNLSLEIPTGAYCVLMGRTGCGKTTLLEILCGLRRPAQGQVFIDGREVTSQPPGNRNIGYIPQDGALFPTMTVREHLGFALRLRRRPEKDIAARVEELADQLSIAGLLDRRPLGFSGGERQRVALGRALSFHPSLLLLDEPLSALDEELRSEMRQLITRLQRQHGITALHVTHDTAEAEAMGGLRLLMRNGKIEKITNPETRTSSFEKPIS